MHRTPNTCPLPRPAGVAFILAVLVILVGVPALASAGWEKIAKGNGILVFKKEVQGRDLPVFKGVGVLDENIFDVLAVLHDAPRRVEWVHKCIDSRMLKQVNELDRVIYNRTTAPWPISDRDVIVFAKVAIDRPNQTVKVSFKTVDYPGFPEVDGVVRMRRLRGFYEIKALSDRKTQVTYQVDADPGGLLPAWLIKLASKDLPLKTIMKLRKQVRKTRKANTYREFLERWQEGSAGDAPNATTRADASNPDPASASDP
jgi:hypothetical protein